MSRRWLFWTQLIFTLGVCAFIIVPVILSVLAGVTDNFFIGVKSGLTLRWIGQVWGLYADTIYLSMLIALSCLAITLVVGVPGAYVLARMRPRVARALEEIIVLPIAVPGLAIALALITTYGGVPDFRTSWLFILSGHVLYTLPFMIRSVLAVLSSMNFRQLEEGAASLGATFWRRFFTVVLPNTKPGIVAGALMVVTLSIGEFNLTWMLHTPMTKTLPVGLADSYASMRLEVASAYTLVFFIMIVPLLVAMQLVARQSARRRRVVTPDDDKRISV
ncbi:ABC transporter permease [Varunaivibrio sulfuroxidans]|uniref:Putative spermidine/putrescine transport system permease protein n=1 Tax=Varunaivibrio sulfuroxidans TaxID=1773489 RepID=A0A4R3J7Q8_9PROT|nr:ABC transporter permease [Varunaivibrio sulfuroxidans]TCS60936.1 putative spermidine/putrescine transport system permease protein [Varunaivibrio sulfuroxidans]WES31656.1 ABC transporter permease [Varunaivibrio sulfuroxidans]